MPSDAPQEARDRWCDVDGAHISLFSCYLELGGLAAS
jgi:hypothetical protein